MEYYYKEEAEMFTFYRVPKLLFTDPRFKGLPNDAKMLYGLMLDRMGLSLRNEKFHDETGRVYIYMKQTEAMELLNVRSPEKIGKLYKALEGVGLLKRKRLGLGHPDRLYIGRLTPIPDAEKDRTSKNESQNYEKRSSDFSKKEVPPIETERILSTRSIYQGEGSRTTETALSPKSCDEYEATIRENIHYDSFQRYEYGPISPDDVDELVTLMSDECSSDKPTIRVGGTMRPRADFRARVLTINDTNIIRILHQLAHQDPDHPIINRRAYLITMLYNHKSTAPTPYEEEFYL